MIKQITTMKRHPDLSMAQFMDAYESRYARFGAALFAKAVRFVRRYVQPMRNPLTGEIRELDFDVIMEIGWASPGDFDDAMKGVATSDVMPAIRESGAKLFASHVNPAFTVLEYEFERPDHATS